MTDIIYLICDQNKVVRMVKTPRSALDLYKGEIPIKVNIEVPDTNWKPPFLEKDIVVDRWDDKIDVNDIKFEGDFVTTEEAQMIRDLRLQRMKEILEEQGFKVERNEEADA